jgi:hypothetical protein
MNIIIYSLINTGIFFVVHLICKVKMQPIFYFFLFLTFLLGIYVIQGHADCKNYNNKMVLTDQQMEEYIDLVELHKDRAETCMMSADIEVWYMPECEDKEKAKYCLGAFMASISAPTPTSKVIMACLAFLGNYSIDCMDSWQRIQYHLHKAKYHYEMMEFYQEVLMKG